jgi:4-amino-4-deoxy-L-arabinose transferase-like glycosyltransferase
MAAAENPPRWLLIALFGIALATRLLWISVPINVDEGLWMRRGPAFVSAILQHRPEDTYQRHHPGVTNMWLIGGAVASRFLVRDLLPTDDLARQSPTLAAYLAAAADLHVVPLSLLIQARVVAAVVTAACMVALFALSWQLFGGMVALIAIAILLLEPFFLGYQRFLTTDANQANFTWLALLTFLLFLRAVANRASAALRWAVLAGVLFGLAVLSKVTALLSVPAFALAAVWWGWRLRGKKAILQLILGVLVALSASIVTAFLLWPALWTDLTGTLMRLSRDVGYEAHAHVQFFLGQIVDTPGIAFYPVVLGYRLSPLLLLSTLLGLFSLALPALRRHLPDSVSLAVIGIDLLFVLLGLSVAGSKLDRYIVPLVPGMALVAASGIAALMSHLAEARSGGGSRESALRRLALSTPVGVLAAIFVVQFATTLPYAPYYVTYFNPLLGGPSQAQNVLMVGNGELLDRAAAWLDQQAQAGDATVAAWYLDSFAPYHDGPVIGLDDVSGKLPEIWNSANFTVLYANMMQRDWPAEVVDYFRNQRPVYQVENHGVSYAQVYLGPVIRESDLPEVPNGVDLDFGGYARLVGYDLETPDVPSGEEVSVALYWQVLQPFPAADFSVHVGVREAGGTEWGGSDGVPVGGMLPVAEWKPGQVLRDVHRVPVPPGTPPGQYTLDVSFWSPALQNALDITDRGMPVGRVASLTGFSVTPPVRSAGLPGDLQIANLVDEEVRLAPDAARLLGYQWSGLTTLRPGDAIPLTLLWQAGASEPDGVHLLLRLSQDGQYWQRTTGHPLGGAFPPQNWIPGQLERDVWNAFVPADAPSGRYELEVVTQTPSGDKPLLSLGRVDVLARHHEFVQPSPRSSQQSALRRAESAAGGDLVGLVGYDLPDAIQAGQVVPLALYWKALGEADRNYARFVHVLDATGSIVAQQDGVPGDGELPLTGWIVGEYVEDDFEIQLPPGLAPGPYRLAVGLYDPANGQRLTTRDGEDRILLSQPLDVR